ncbi:MAG TPA: peptidoglycan bridge formation glycyltransferase FemA/FemB family protein, partial [candidate division Zixibacteria bacterium]|nr:peptidoglycan bridge formation glycyltransferase FemA/FemB family protein [candidate division Zixibacteria bacterium]
MENEKTEKMKFAEINETDIARWDKYVTRIDSAHFMQSFGWSNVQQQSGWKKSCFAAIDDDDEIRGAAILLSKPLPVLKRSIYYIPRGPVVNLDDSIAFSFLMESICKYVKDNKGIFVRIDPYLEENTEVDLLFADSGFKKLDSKWSFWNGPKYVLWLRLDEGIDALFKKLPGKIRNKIRYPSKKGVEFVRGDLSDIHDFYSLMLETATQKGIGHHSLDYYKKLYKTLSDCGIAQLFMAKFEGRSIATGISLAYGKRAWLLYLASSKEYFKLRPNRALQWEMIKWAVEQGCTVYDFRGTATDDPPSPADPGYGVYEFKKSFGPDFIRLAGYYDYVVNKPLYLLFIFAEKYLFDLMVKGLVWLSKL